MAAPAPVNIGLVARDSVRGVWADVGGLVWAFKLPGGSLDNAFRRLAAILLPGLDSPYRRAIIAEILALRAEIDPNHDPSWEPLDHHAAQAHFAFAPVNPAGPVSAAGPLNHVAPVGPVIQIAPAGGVAAAAAAVAVAGTAAPPNIIPPIALANGKFSAQFNNHPGGRLSCPVCHDAVSGRPGMKHHIERFHANFHLQVYGTPAPPRTPCPRADCAHDAATRHQVTDHLLMVHGEEEAAKMKRPDILRRMKPVHLNPKYQALALATNTLKRRINDAEGQLAALVPGFTSQHGLNLVLRSESGRLETDAGAIAGLAAVRAAGLNAGVSANQQYLANMLAAARVEAEEVGALFRGGQGSYAQVAQELEEMLAAV